MEGYSYEVVGDDILEYKCPICLMLLRQTILLPCSHSACKDCLTQWEQQGDAAFYQCPSCQTAYRREQVFEGRLIDRIITTSLKVRCKQHLQNCEWIGTISEYCEIHQRSCLYEPVACEFPGCNLTVSRKDLNSHQENCEYRIIQCYYCMGKLQYNQLRHHLDICGHYDVTCRQGCGQSFRRMDIPTHIAEECPNTEILCSYREMGCTQKAPRKDIAEHMSSSTQQHSDLLLQHTLRLTKEVRDLEQANGVLRIEIHQIRESSNIKISQLNQEIREKEIELHNINERMVVIENEMNHKSEKASEDLKTICEIMNILDTKLEVHEKKSNEDILLIKNEVLEEFKEIAVATSLCNRLSEKDRSNDWSFNAELDPAVERLLEEDLAPQADQKRVGFSSKKKGKGKVDLYKDRESQIEAIEASFEAAKKPITRHYSNAELKPVEILPFFPDFQFWHMPCAHIIFDTEPTPRGKNTPATVDQMSLGMIRGMEDESGDQFVAYFLPTNDTLDKRKSESAGKEPNEEEEYDYKLAREYNWKVKNKAIKGIEENYFFVFRENEGVFYNEIQTCVRLNKRRGQGGAGGVSSSVSKLVVKNREPTENELRRQNARLVQLENVVQDDDEEGDEDSDNEEQPNNNEDKNSDVETPQTAEQKDNENDDNNDDEGEEKNKETEDKSDSGSDLFGSSSDDDDDDNDDDCK